MVLSQATKTRIMAIFIAAVMLISTAGFALISSVNTGQPEPQNTQDPLQNNVVYRELAGPEIVTVLRTGRMLLRYYSPADCEPCKGVAQELQSFASQNQQFVFVQLVVRNQTAFEALGFDGKIDNLDNLTVTQDTLMDYVCDKGALRPKECVLREIGEASEQNTGE